MRPLKRQHVDTPMGPVTFTDQGAGAPVVAVHGAPGSARDFRRLGEALGDRARLIAVDMPGSGGTPSRAWTDHDPVYAAALTGAFIEALGLERPVLLGHSFGSAIVAEVAAEVPARGLAFVAAMTRGVHLPLRLTRGLRLSRVVRSSLGRRLLMPPLRAVGPQLGFSPRLTDAQVVGAFHATALVDLARHRGNLDALTVPCFVAWADDDRLIHANLQVELSEALPPGGRLRLDHGGHNVQSTRAVEIADALASWISALG